MADMIKFFKGLEASLPASGVNGALYITTDEGAIYLGTGTGMKRLGDFVQVANVASLPAKAHESCLYYCVAENILAKWNGTEWKQINKQPTAEEMKTLLGLGSMAYKSEVAEGDLNADLKAKVNAAAEGNHSHDNKALLDTYTQTEADLADAVAKKHAHTFNETELNKIAEGDVAKWNGVVADHLTSADKTTLENSIKEAKQAGTDANTNIEAYKVTNDARVKAVEDDVAEITDGTNGILAQAKSYSDGKLATARTEITAEIDADVKVVADDLAGYKTSNDAALAGVKATAEAAAVKTEVETALAGKVDKVEGKSLIADSEIARLADVHNYDDTQVKADIAKKADAATMTTELGKKVDKVEGYSLVSDTEIARLANVDNYDDTALAGRVSTAEGKIADLETESAKHALKTEVEAVDAKFANYKTAEAQKAIDDEQDRRLGVIEGDYLKAADIANFETKENVKKVADDLAAYVESNDAALALKADKSVVDAMYTNAQIDGFIAEAKKYADDNDADTKYGIVYDSDNKKIKLVEGGTDVEIDASAFIKDGMISNVTIGDDNDLIITFNTDAGKENIVLPLDQLVDIYTGVEGDRIKVTVNADKSISADLVAGSITKDYLDASVKASLALADSAIQAHQDISHLATKTELQGVDSKFGSYTTTTDLNAALDLKADKTQVATDIAKAVQDEANRIDDELSITKEELEMAIGSVNEEATNGIADARAYAEEYTNGKVAILNDALANKADKATTLSGYGITDAYTKTEVEALLTWGSF